MKNYILFAFMTLSLALSAYSAKRYEKLPDETLRRYAAQMLIVGFKGDSIDENSDAARYVRDLHVGGIILFDVDLTGFCHDRFPEYHFKATIRATHL